MKNQSGHHIHHLLLSVASYEDDAVDVVLVLAAVEVVVAVTSPTSGLFPV